MKLTVLVLVLLQGLCCSGFPLFQPGIVAMARQALGASLRHVNNLTAGTNLYGVTYSSIKRIIPIGLSSYDMILKFGVRETVCPKSRTADPETCNFRRGHFVSAASCSSRVRLTADVSELVFVRCGSASSSSSESSSEEVFMALPSTGSRTPHENGGEAPPLWSDLPATQGGVGHMDENNFLE
ncbi:secreted phosphoprotein 24 [Scleropages formosus]|uniref:Secreted phosphoprotein 24 n=1 Tax=Scleropages formosus TaxID=113540 RepID=A0A8C9TZY5_SCLFO|nr:secreted phosphoprotein 24 [Scleropages formosus]